MRKEKRKHSKNFILGIYIYYIMESYNFNRLEKIKEAKMDARFPDEVDTPIDMPARVRFQKLVKRVCISLLNLQFNRF